MFPFTIFCIPLSDILWWITIGFPALLEVAVMMVNATLPSGQRTRPPTQPTPIRFSFPEIYNSLEIKLFGGSYYPSGSHETGIFYHPADIWQSVDSFLVVKLRVGRHKGHCSTSSKAQASPSQQRITWPKILYQGWQSLPYRKSCKANACRVRQIIKEWLRQWGSWAAWGEGVWRRPPLCSSACCYRWKQWLRGSRYDISRIFMGNLLIFKCWPMR